MLWLVLSYTDERSLGRAEAVSREWQTAAREAWVELERMTKRWYIRDPPSDAVEAKRKLRALRVVEKVLDNSSVCFCEPRFREDDLRFHVKLTIFDNDGHEKQVLRFRDLYEMTDCTWPVP